MPTTMLTIEYDGGGFRGWADQPGLRTVEATLTEALATVLREPVSLTVAGRTDAGVHASGQVASFHTAAAPPASLAARVNGLLAPDLAVLAAERVPDGFDARRDARARTYRYRLLARRERSPLERDRALWWPYRVDRAALDACADAIVGTHDFSAFTPTQTAHVRFERDVISAAWREAGPMLELWLEADSFMRRMVRVLVGTMLEVAGGRRSPADFAGLLEGAPRERAGDTAPPHGLFLVAVRYEDRDPNRSGPGPRHLESPS